MRRAISALYRGVGPGLLQAPTLGAARLLDPVAPNLSGRLRAALAEAHFTRGDYAAARRVYAGIPRGRFRAKADQMCDWIDFKAGDVAGGWPRYPGARFAPGTHPIAAGPPTGPVQVANPNLPVELETGLGLRPWQPGASAQRPLLVFFNFRNSLGGELLAACVVRRFKDVTGLPLVLACEPRLVDVLAANFPGDTVLSKTDDLAPLHATCQGYVTARHTLQHVVRGAGDFAAIAATPLRLPGGPVARAAGRPRVAISWKTTNRTQGAYRNIPLDALIAALAPHDICYHSAQHGVTGDERHALTAALGDRMQFDTIPTSGTVGALASRLAAMDAIVTIDNSVLHIAGAFGMRCYGLLSVPSYWAWPMAGSDSRWYRDVHLVHQGRQGDWSDVLAEVSAALAALDGRA